MLSHIPAHVAPVRQAMDRLPFLYHCSRSGIAPLSEESEVNKDPGGQGESPAVFGARSCNRRRLLATPLGNSRGVGRGQR